MAVVPGARSHTEGWAPLWAVPCVASRWRVRPVDGGAARPACEAGAVQPRSWGWGSGSGNVPWPEGAAPVQLPFSRWVFCSLSLSFLYWAHTSHSFTAQRVQQKSPFLFQLAFPAPLRTVPGVVVQRGPAYRLC